MITNYFLFVAGLVGLCFAFGHGYWVQRRIMGEVNESAIEKQTKHSIFIFLHYTTVTLLLSAAALMIASTFLDAKSAHSLAWFIAAINAGNLLVFVGVSVMKNREELKKGIPQIIFMLAWLGIVVAGIID